MLERLIVTVVDFYVVLIIIYAVLSWLPHENGTLGTVYAALEAICEPYLRLFRKIIPPAGGIDFSPVIAIVVLELVVRLIVFLL